MSDFEFESANAELAECQGRSMEYTAPGSDDSATITGIVSSIMTERIRDGSGERKVMVARVEILSDSLAAPALDGILGIDGGSYKILDLEKTARGHGVFAPEVERETLGVRVRSRGERLSAGEEFTI